MIRQGFKWLQKPPLGYGLDLSHPFAASGLRGGWLLNENGGTLLGDFTGNAQVATLVGAPTWSATSAGSALTSFSTSNFVKSDTGLPAFFSGAAYPVWFAVYASNTSTTTNIWPLSLSKTNSANQLLGIAWNLASAGQVCYFVRNNVFVGPGTALSSTQTCNDGKPHLVCGVSFSATDHRLYFDGKQVATSSTSTAYSYTFDACSIGALRFNNGTSNVFPGSVTWAALGQGAVPDFAALYKDFWAPYQTPAYRRWYAPSTTVAAPIFRPATLSLGAGGPFFATPVNG